jgi:hypoxia up-regulated 1
LRGVAALPQAKRTKEVLSANTEAPAIVEELAGGRDFRASVSRETLEGLAGNWFARAVAPLTTLLERNHLVRNDDRDYD